MAAMLDGCVYHRRSDRSPEKEAFYHLPVEDRKLIGQLRSAMSGARQKVQTLRNTIEDKDRHISREETLRRAAVERMEQLVDMYGDPAVMAELRNRLPHSGKEDPKVKWQQELEHRDNVEVESRGVRMHSPEPVTESSHNTRRRDTGHRSHSADRTHRGKSSKPHRSRSDTEVDSDEEGRPRSRQLRSSHGHIHHQFYPYSYPPPQVIYVEAPNGSAVTTTTPVMQLAPTVPLPAQFARPPPPLRLVASAPQATTANPDATINASSSVATSGENANSPPPPPPAPDGWSEGKLHALKESSKAREQNRQISQLVSDLDAANELNKKLQLKLTETERELESLRISQQTLQTSLEADASGKAAALVEEIYRAQKQRDQAMLARLKTANEERDAALERLKQAEAGSDGYESGPDDNPDDMDMRSLLHEVTTAESAGQIKRRGGALADGISRRQRQRHEVNASEMRAVIDQRDDAVNKAKSLECELLRLQRQQRGRATEKQQHASDKSPEVLKQLRAKLLATQQERDVALQKVQKLEEELQTLRVYYSLHKSLSQEANLRDQFNNTLHSIEGELKQRDDVVDHAQKESNRLLSQMKDAINSKNQMCEQLAKANAGQQEAEERCQRLERLVNVLRRKINGLGSKSDDY